MKPPPDEESWELPRAPARRVWPLLALLVLNTSCSSGPAYQASRYSSSGYSPTYYLPSPTPGGKVVAASWYGPGFNGKRTSSGEVFHQNQMTAASPNLPLGSKVRVTNLSNGRSVMVRINDRGPFVGGRGLDLSKGAAEKIGMKNKGVGLVKVSGVSSAPLTDGYTPSSQRTTSRPRAYWTKPRKSRKIVSDPIGSWLSTLVPSF